VRLALDHLGQRRRRVCAIEASLAGEHLEHHTPERPDVGAPIDRLPASMFRRHVSGRAEQRADAGHANRTLVG
jgi:hypothetical protein